MARAALSRLSRLWRWALFLGLSLLLLLALLFVAWARSGSPADVMTVLVGR